MEKIRVPFFREKMHFSQRRRKRSIGYFSDLYAKFTKNLRCLRPRLTHKFSKKPKETYNYGGRKKRDSYKYADYGNYAHEQYTPYDTYYYEPYYEDYSVDTIEDCFDDVPKPRYGFR